MDLVKMRNLMPDIDKPAPASGFIFKTGFDLVTAPACLPTSKVYRAVGYGMPVQFSTIPQSLALAKTPVVTARLAWVCRVGGG